MGGRGKRERREKRKRRRIERNGQRERERKGQTKSQILVSSTTGENPSGPGPLSMHPGTE